MNSKLLSVWVLRAFFVGLIVAGGSAALPAERLYAAPNAKKEVEAPKEVKVNINTAAFDELQTVRGIGPALAGRIIEFRDANGPFKSVDDLVAVSGIGDAKLQKIKAQTVV